MPTMEHRDKAVAKHVPKDFKNIIAAVSRVIEVHQLCGADTSAGCVG
jgi:hypothetical protein